VDTEDLLKWLTEHKVDFAVIGATALPVYWYARATLDIDVFTRPAPSNAETALEALKEFG
jgi:hypothetical protein